MLTLFYTEIYWKQKIEKAFLKYETGIDGHICNWSTDLLANSVFSAIDCALESILVVDKVIALTCAQNLTKFFGGNSWNYFSHLRGQIYHSFLWGQLLNSLTVQKLFWCIYEHGLIPYECHTRLIKSSFHKEWLYQGFHI